MAIQQLSVFLENRAGQLAEITAALAQKGIDLAAINIAETADYGVLRIITTETDKARIILAENGFIAACVSVTAVLLPDEPGALNKLLQILAEENINLQYMYSVFGKKSNKACMILRVQEQDRLQGILQKAGIETIDTL